MRNYFYCISLILTSFYLTAQDSQEIPRATQRSLKLLTAHLISDCTSDHQKVDSIHHWITNNIDYDYKLVQNSNPFGYQPPEKTLRTKKAICNSYVELMQEMLLEAGINSEIVEGYVHRNEPGFYEVLFQPTHVWIAIELDGTWYLADPTWDSGYIGRIPKKEKNYPKRWDRERHYSSEAKRLKREVKITEKKEKFDKKLSERDPYTEKVGFVRNPTTEYYMVDADTFLLTHLPVLPEWQLRDQTLTIEQFSAEDSVRELLKSPEGPVLEHTFLVESFEEKEILDQWLYAAKASHAFNHRNHGTAATNYYYTVGVFLDTELKKILKRYPKMQTQPLWEELSFISDSAIFHAKLALKTVKESEKNRTKYYKSSFKTEGAAHKAIDKEAVKIEKLFEKIDKAIGTSKSSAKDEINAINERLEKFAPLIRNVNVDAVTLESEEPELMKIYQSFDSINKIVDSTMNVLKYHRDHPSQQGLIDAISEGRWHVDYSNAYVSVFSMETKDSVAYHDAKAVECLQRAQSIITDSLMLEIQSKNLSKSVKALDNFVKGQRTKLKELEDAKLISSASRTEKELNALVNQRYEQLLQINLNSQSYHNLIARNMKIIEGANDRLQNSSKFLDKSREERDEHLHKQLETEYERLEKLYKEIQEAAQKWKKELKSRKK